MVTPNLRRVSPTTWAVVAIILLALLPESFPLAPIRGIARYLLVAYLPGLAIWNRLRSTSSSLVDVVLYPSLLSILPFAWVGLAAVALGFDLRIAGLVAITFFLAVGFLLGWSAQVRGARGDRIALGLAAVLALILLAVPFAANSFQAVAWDAPLHAAIASRILGGVIPPDSPMMAGQPANYYWIYHFYSALLLRLTGWSIYQVFAVLNVHALVLFALAGYRIAGRLTTNLFGRISAAWMLVFGLNAFGWIIFLSRGSQDPDRWYSLVAPFAMVRGYSPSLGSLIHEFLDGGPFAISFAFTLIWLDIVIARVQGDGGRMLLTGTLILASALYLYPLSALFVTAASLAALLLLVTIDRRSSFADRKRTIVDTGVMALAAAIVTAPYAWNILHAKTGKPFAVHFDFEFAKNQIWSMAATLGVMVVLVVPAFWRAIRDRSREVLFLALFVTVITAAALVVKVALDAEYKLVYLLVLGLGPIIALAWDVWRQTRVTQFLFVVVLAVSVPTSALTSYSFATRPPQEKREPARIRLLQWIREQTPADAILVEYPYWLEQRASAADYFYLDRYWFDIAVYANRRQLIGYETGMLEQWGYGDIALRQTLARKLIEGQTLDSADVSYLMSFGAPIILVTNSAAVRPDMLNPAVYLPVYEDGDIRAYRLVLAK